MRTVLPSVSSYTHPVFMYTEKSYSSGFVHFKLIPAVCWMTVNILQRFFFFSHIGLYQDLLQDFFPESNYIIIVYMRG